MAQATSATTGGLSGTVKDDTGAPIAGVNVAIRGVTSEATTSDAKGDFAFGGLPPGLYAIVASKAGYQTARQADLAIFAGEVENVAIALPRASFSSLRTIATVRSAARGTFNTSTASVSTVSSQDFANQGATQVMDALNQLPGVQASYSADSTNPVSPAGASFPNIRDALSYETATLIDGHPVSVGRYGDYELNFINPFMLQGVEVIKGPGALAPQTNYAIGGTVNFRTLDPTATATPNYTFGYTNFGGTFFNFGISDTIGRLGFVADVAGTNDPSPINNAEYIGNINNGVAYINGTSDVLTYNNTQTPVPGTSGALYNEYNLRVCCFTVTGDYNNLSELLKLRYKFSPATTATVSYLGSQSTADENGVTSQQTPSIFVPGAGYAGTVPLGSTFLSNNVYPAPDEESNNEPILQAEVSTTLGNDTILARYYHASIYRLITQGGSNPNLPTWATDTLSGTNSGGLTYNDVTIPVAWYEYYREDEIDKLGGTDLQYSHPYGEGSDATLSWSHTNSQTQDFEYETDYLGTNADNSFNGTVVPETDTTVPGGSSEIYNTFRFADINNFSNKLTGMLSVYENMYQWTTAQSCGSPCNVDGSNAVFATNRSTHLDERGGLTYALNPNVIVRAAAGSSIAPPYMYLLSKYTGAVSYTSGNPYATQALNNPNLQPETSFGYDLGADVRLKNTYYASADVYMTNLFNQYNPYTEFSGTCTPAVNAGCPATGVPILATIYGNVSNSRYEGIELSLKRVVQNGIGFVISGSTQRGYAYNLPANFWCSGVIPGACTPANYNINLNVVPGQNFTVANGYYHTSGCPASGSYYCGATSLWNQSVPYLQGYAEVNWQNARGWYASFGGTLFGKNNSLGEPPFVEARATLRVPLTSTLAFQVSGTNIFNAYSGLFPIVGGGVGVPLITGGLGIGVGSTLGPAEYRFALTKALGSGAAPNVSGYGAP